MASRFVELREVDGGKVLVNADHILTVRPVADSNETSIKLVSGEHIIVAGDYDEVRVNVSGH